MNNNMNGVQYSNVQNSAMNNGQYNVQANNQLVGSITINRPSSFMGCLIPYDVFVDNCFIGTVANGETKQFPLYYGSHFVELKHGLNGGSQQIIINDTQKNLVFECKLKMGLVTNKIDFKLVNYYN